MVGNYIKNLTELTMNRFKNKKDLLSYVVYGSLLMLLGFSVTILFVEPAPPNKMVIAAGSEGGAYLRFAREYKKQLAKDGIELEIIETLGSVENLDLLAAGKADAALLQSGIAEASECPGISCLGSLYFEPLWVFVRQGFALNNIDQLKECKIVIGPQGSGTRKVVLQLLRDNGLTSEDLTVVELRELSPVEALVQEKIDIFFKVSALDSPLIMSLVNDRGVALVPFLRAEANIRRHRFLAKVVLPQGVISLKNNVPATDMVLIAPVATLVVSDGLHPALAGLLSQVIDRVHRQGSLLDSRPHQFPSQENLDFPLNDEAERYYRHGVPFLQRYLPFWMAIQLDRLKIMLLPLLALLIPLFKLLPLTYRWRMRSRIYRWYDLIQTIDYDVRQESSSASSCIARLNEIEEEVRQICVPLSFASELYSLRQHIDLLRRQIAVLENPQKQ